MVSPGCIAIAVSKDTPDETELIVAALDSSDGTIRVLWYSSARGAETLDVPQKVNLLLV